MRPRRQPPLETTAGVPSPPLRASGPPPRSVPPFRGAVANVIHQFVGGLRYSMGYCGARTIPEFQEKAKMVRVTAAGLREAHPHDVVITKDAPNYTTSN